MKKLIALMMAVLLVAALTACGTQESKPTEPDTNQTDPTGSQQTDPVVDTEEVFSFEFEGVELVPGAAFDPSVLPEADGVYEVPSCAIEGTDNVYSYEALEITAYDDGTGEVIYSIYLLDANTSTPEGLYVGDDLARVTELYGSDYTQNDTELVFTKGATSLCLIMENDCVLSIEYRMVT